MANIIKKVIKNCIPYGIVKAKENRATQLTPKAEPVLPVINGTEPDIYNAKGEKMRTFYLQDLLTPDYPLSFVYGSKPQYINWDRYNYGLPIHFYTHDNVLRTNKYAVKKFAYFIESEEILGCDYQLFDKNPGLEKEFNAIFTTSAKHLDKYPNAKFCPAGGLWYTKPSGGGQANPEMYRKKTKNISIISSDKTMCPLHIARIEISKKLKRNGLADTFGTFDGGPKIKINKTLDDYRYSIAFENNVAPYYFTEKIMNCFAAQTIPVYVGATEIGRFFNTDGIIMTTAKELLENPEKVLKQCTTEEYERRLPAVIDNYNRVWQYSVIEDWLYTNYKDLF